MSRTLKIFVLCISIAILVFTVVGTLAVKASSPDDGAYRQLGVYGEVLTRIRGEYVEEPSISKVTEGALHGLLESLDANSSYLDPAEYQAYKTHKNEGKAGIGATVSKRFGYAAVISVMPGGPADKAGMDSGDIIEAIEGKSTHDMSLAEIDGDLSGAPGSSVSMSIVRAQRALPTKVQITREVVKIPPINAENMPDGIGYIKVDAFPEGESRDIATKIKSQETAGAKKFILDLRDASEGEENEGIAVANLFLNHGTITYLQGQKYPKQVFTADPSKTITDLPLVVLVNRGTAGPAEIVAAAVMNNNRGDVLGDKTFGVGSVQKVIEIPSGGAVILSVAKYYAPDGKAIQDTAITPNIVVADKSEDAVLPDDDDTTNNSTEPLKKDKPVGPDVQLQRAIQVLKNRTTEKASAAPGL